MYSDIFVYLKDTKFIMICSGIAAFINISLNYVFINIYGYIAAAYTTLISYIVMALLLIIAVRIKYEQKNRSKFDLYDNRIILSVSTITVVVSMFCALVYDYPILRFLLFIVLVVVALGLWRTMKQQTLN